MFLKMILYLCKIFSMKIKAATAKLSIISNLLLIVLKLIVGIITGSVSILSEAMHSSMDLLASIIAYFSVSISGTPADKKHPYGHGKFENISGVAEALLIFVAAIWIIVEAVHKLTGHVKIENISYGIVVMFISTIVNYLVSNRLYKVAKETDSIALEADALHLKTDVYSSLAVGLGLILILFTGKTFLDPIIAILVAFFIIWEAFKLLKNAFSPLVDSAMTEEEIEIITGILELKSLSYHNLKTQRAGSDRFVDLHLEMPQEMTLKNVHSICDELELEISQKIKNIQINIHAEPKEVEI